MSVSFSRLDLRSHTAEVRCVGEADLHTYPIGICTLGTCRIPMKGDLAIRHTEVERVCQHAHVHDMRMHMHMHMCMCMCMCMCHALHRVLVHA